MYIFLTEKSSLMYYKKCMSQDPFSQMTIFVFLKLFRNILKKKIIIFLNLTIKN